MSFNYFAFPILEYFINVFLPTCESQRKVVPYGIREDTSYRQEIAIIQAELFF